MTVKSFSKNALTSLYVTVPLDKTTLKKLDKTCIEYKNIDKNLSEFEIIVGMYYVTVHEKIQCSSNFILCFQQ